MDLITRGQKLERCGMQFADDLGPGLFGHRWSVELVQQQKDQSRSLWVAEVATVENSVLEAQCDFLSRQVGSMHPRGVVAPIATEWIDDYRFTAVWDLHPEARTVASFLNDPDFIPPDEREFWKIAAIFYRSVSQLHRRGLIHRAISPHVFYVDGGLIVLGETWWAAPLEETTIYDFIPEVVRSFAAPEVLRGGQATKQSDLFSLGALLRFLLTAKRRHLTGEENRTEASSLNSETELGRLTLGLLQDDPARRPSPPQIEAILNEKLLSRVNSWLPKDWKIGLTSEFGVSLYGVAAEQLIEITDLCQYAQTLHLGCRHEDREASFKVDGLLLMGGRTYLALADSPEHSERLEYTPLTVVRLENDWQVRTITERELMSVREELAENVYRGTSRDLAYAEFLLGPIREWKPSPNSFPSTLEPG